MRPVTPLERVEGWLQALASSDAGALLSEASLPEVWAAAVAFALVLRALAVLGRGTAGAAWRTVTAILAGILVVAWLGTSGVELRALPLHALTAVVVLLTPWERPHTEAAQLRMGRRRRRTRLPWERAVLLLLATVAATAWLFLA